ncbi:MAG: iron-sulfur cluster assembly scaffold protein [Alphaproteobacteria bacterium]
MSASEPINDLYSREILRHTAALSRLGRLDAPDGTGDAVSRTCGSHIVVDIAMEDGRVSDYAQEVQACALGQCAASIMARTVIGATAREVRDLRDRMHVMLKDGGPAPDGRFADLALLEAVRDYPARHGSVMLVFDALVQAVDQGGREAQGA